MQKIAKILLKSLFVNSLPADLLRSDRSVERVRTLFKRLVSIEALLSSVNQAAILRGGYELRSVAY